MKKIILTALCLLAPLGSAYAQGSVGHSAQAVKHGSQAAANSAASVAHGLVAAGKVTSGVAAVPLKAVGAVGKAADAAGDALMQEAGTGPLPVSDEAITAGPPPHAE